MSSAPRYTKMMQWLNYRVRVTLQDARVMVGSLLAFDRHMNLVLADTEEFHIKRSKEDEKEIKRMLGFVLLRGECVVSVFPEAPPVKDRKVFQGSSGPGKSEAISRGSLPEISSASLAAPMRASTVPMSAIRPGPPR